MLKILLWYQCWCFCFAAQVDGHMSVISRTNRAFECHVDQWKSRVWRMCSSIRSTWANSTVWSPGITSSSQRTTYTGI